MTKLILIVFSLLLTISISQVDAQNMKCGKNSEVNRIVGGKNTNSSTYPWQCLLTTKFMAGTRTVGYRCGGSLISDTTVLTAAHCFYGRTGEVFIGVDVKCGDTHLTKNEGTEVYAVGKEVIIHADYNSKTNQNDIALIILDQPLDFNGKHKHLEPVCLPLSTHYSEESMMADTKHEECMSTGFGDLADSGPSATILQEVKLPYLPNTDCKAIWRTKVYTEVMLCAGPTTGGYDTCQGDSGGPLQCQLKNGVWVIQGVTSFGGKCAAKGLTGVYTRIGAFVDWIQKYMVTSKNSYVL